MTVLLGVGDGPSLPDSVQMRRGGAEHTGVSAPIAGEGPRVLPQGYRDPPFRVPSPCGSATRADTSVVSNVGEDLVSSRGNSGSRGDPRRHAPPARDWR